MKVTQQHEVGRAPQDGRAHSQSGRELLAPLRVREMEEKNAELEFLQQQARVRRMENEFADLDRRRHQRVRSGSMAGLRERMVLDALIRAVLKKGRELERLRARAAELLVVYEQARNRRRAVSELCDRRRAQQEEFAARRSEQDLSDLTTASWLRRAESLEEEV